LEIARPLPDGSLETLHEERDPIRPGEGVFTTGSIPAPVVARLISTLRRYAALGKRFGATLRAVATSAVRDARNRDEVVRRARSEAGVDLEVISGKEEARLICLGVLHGKSPGSRSLCIDIGGGSTEVAVAKGEEPSQLFSVAVGAVRLTELFGTADSVSAKKLELVREYADEAIARALPARLPGAPRRALGSSGTIGAVVGFAAIEGTGNASTRQITRAVERLVELGGAGRRRRFDPRRADILVAGAVILESLSRHLRLESVAAVDRGLRDGLLLDTYRRLHEVGERPSFADAARAVGQRFAVDAPHAEQVRRLALSLFDDLAKLHGLPAATRTYLEAAALLHDVGNAVSYSRHHKHSYYLIQNADIPGLSDRERELVARVARYHRRSAPDPKHAGMMGLTATEARTVRRLAVLLRLADSLDRSHHQPVKKLRVELRGPSVTLRVIAPRSVDLELWDAGHEAALFGRVFGRPLRIESARR
ncbi:MAG: Ppx/GppA family phosphatase, partial [Deltaproteobacteria bacterium]|nr:Ppx/GppA family phosphatase [Deltaproteobacteria bacterium]